MYGKGAREEVTIDSVIERAKELAKAIGESPEYQNFRKKHKELKSDAEATKLLNQLREKRKQINEKLRLGKPIEPQEKREIQQIQAQLNKNPTFISYAKAQGAYFNLIKRINEAMTESIKEKLEILNLDEE